MVYSIDLNVWIYSRFEGIRVFKEQVNYWEERIDYFKLRGNQFQLEHSIEVKGLFETIVLRIEDINKQSDLGDW